MTNDAIQEQAQTFTAPASVQTSVPSAPAPVNIPKKTAEETEEAQLSQGAKSWMEKITQAWEASGTPASMPQEVPAPQEAPIPQEIPVPQQVPVPQEAPIPQEIPVPQQVPIPQEVPAPQQAPIPQEIPVPQQVPSPQEAPVPQQAPIPQEIPIPQEAPPPQQPPIPQQAPAPVETPAQQAENVSIPVLGPRSGIHITLNGEKLWLPQKPQGGYIFLDMLNLVDIDPSKPQGNILLLLNGRNAAYLDNVENGDEIEIRWEKRS